MSIHLHNLSKSYDQLSVFQDLTMEFEEPQIYCLMGASGSGKTTLFRILLGLEDADSGTISGRNGRRMAAVFQENRLCETYSPLANVLLVTDPSYTETMVRAELCRLLPEESITRPVSTLSGGMKRRTAICRALLAPSDIILMDEPFTGLDEQTKQQVMTYIQEKSAGKLLLISTHQEEDIALLGGILCLIS
ncbi:MAG: ATP-binding cassette domain-containing protein [Hungatella sp.]